MDLYIYYRVPVAQADAFRREATAMQNGLRRQCNVDAALKRRPDAQDGLHTWMEIYPATAPDFAEKLEQAVAAHSLLAFIDGPRHTEQFLDLSTCV